MYTAAPSSYHTSTVRHARLTRSQIFARMSPTAQRILAALAYLLKVNEEAPLSRRIIAQRVRVSETTVSRLIPVLAAEPGNTDGNHVPFIRRRWCDARQCYLITLLPAPEVRGWYEHEPTGEEA